MDRMTVKSQEALRAAVDFASRRGNPEVLSRAHSAGDPRRKTAGIAAPLVQKAGAQAPAMAPRVRRTARLVSSGDRRRRAQPLEPRPHAHPTRRRRGQVAEGRFRLGRAFLVGRAPSSDRDVQAIFDRPASATTSCSRRWSRCAARSGSPTRTPRVSSKPSRSTRAISPTWRVAGRSIRSSAATKRFAA